MLVEFDFGFSIDFLWLWGERDDLCDFGGDCLFLRWAEEAVVFDICYVVVFFFGHSGGDGFSEQSNG